MMNTYRQKIGKYWYIVCEHPSETIKTVGGSWDKRQKFWKLPPNYATIERLYSILPESEIQLSEQLQAEKHSQFGFKAGAWQRLNTKVPKHIVFYPHQKEALRFLTSSHFKGALLALSPGLGKTWTAIIGAMLLKATNVLVICPKSLIPNWIYEIDYCEAGHLNWMITNVEQIVSKATFEKGRNNKQVCKKINEPYDNQYDLIIFDESILLKNRDSKRSLAVAKLREQTKRVWLLSGSPISKFNDDLYSQMRILLPHAFTSYWRFVDQYCLKDESVWGTKVVGNRNNIKMQNEFKDLAFFRNQSTEFPDLKEPLKDTIRIPLLPQQQKYYDQMKAELLIELEDKDFTAATRLAQTTRLQQIVSNPVNLGEDFKPGSAKLDVLVDLFKAGSIQTPCLIWSHWQKSAQVLQQALDGIEGIKVRQVDGTTKDNYIHAYQQGHVDVLILSLGVGKYGHSLPTTKTIIYYEKSFDGDAYKQSLERVSGLRIKNAGLKHVPLILTLHSPGTTDDLIEWNLRTKMRSISDLTNEDFSKLLKGLSV